MAELNLELPDDARREQIILSIWYRARHSRGFRRKDEARLGESIDPLTGLERSEADLRPRGEAICGPEFVFAGPVQPDRLAEECLLREEPDGSTPSLGQCRGLAVIIDLPDPLHPPRLDSETGQILPGATQEATHMRCPTHERGRAEEEAAHLAREHPEWNARVRGTQGREAWTDDERQAISELTYLFQKTLLDFGRKGWLRFGPAIKYESDTGHNELYAKGIDDRGLPFQAVCTPEGLDEAERRIAGDPKWAHGAFSILEAAPTEIKAQAMKTSPWAHSKYQDEK